MQQDSNTSEESVYDDDNDDTTGDDLGMRTPQQGQGEKKTTHSPFYEAFVILTNAKYCLSEAFPKITKA